MEILIRRHVLRRLIWVCTVFQLPFHGSPDYDGDDDDVDSVFNVRSTLFKRYRDSEKVIIKGIRTQALVFEIEERYRLGNGDASVMI